jgi:threonine/homoserine/homoserine lactone efflux protein
MNTVTAICAFSLGAALATMTPGLDTALVLRAAALEGKRRGILTAFGIGTGVLAWGSAAAYGLAELLRASATVYEIVRWTGAAYLLYLGTRMLLRPRTEFSVVAGVAAGGRANGPRLFGMEWYRRGLFTNLLNPKVGVFYVSFLPQFIPQDATDPRALMLLFAMIHSLEAIVWFSALTLVTDRLTPILRRGRMVKRLDQAMGGLLISFGLRLALDKRT